MQRGFYLYMISPTHAVILPVSSSQNQSSNPSLADFHSNRVRAVQIADRWLFAPSMVGHASTLIQVAGVNILTDPVWSERAGPFSFVGPKRVTKPGIDFDDLPPLNESPSAAHRQSSCSAWIS